MINSKEEYIKMSELESTHWWYRSLHELVLITIKKHFSNREPVIVDAGCGTGGLIQYLNQNGYDNTRGFDVSEFAVSISKSMSLQVITGDLRKIDELIERNSVDILILNDVLYFLTPLEQGRLLTSIHGLLKSNGIVILNIPSMRIFSGNHDRIVGITRRFEKEDIPLLLGNGKFNISNKMYWPFFLSPVIYLSRLFQKISGRMNSKMEFKSDLQKENSLINFCCYYITKVENRILKAKPFGSSLFLVLSKIE